MHIKLVSINNTSRFCYFLIKNNFYFSKYIFSTQYVCCELKTNTCTYIFEFFTENFLKEPKSFTQFCFFKSFSQFLFVLIYIVYNFDNYQKTIRMQFTILLNLHINFKIFAFYPTKLFLEKRRNTRGKL